MDQMIQSKPLLGTFVEIRVEPSDNQHSCDAAIRNAFLAIEKVHQLMNFHAPESELSRFNRGDLEEQALDPWVQEVLRFGREIEALSQGSFRLKRDHEFDLSGIAKGFAVDQAVAALRAAGVTHGAVNAGGDLHVFGTQSEPVHVRDPLAPQSLLQVGSIANGAVATSGYYGGDLGHAQSPLYAPTPKPWSVTVFAPTAMIADALTKVVHAARVAQNIPAQLCEQILTRFGAQALVLPA